MTSTENTTWEIVSHYYERVIRSQKDLKTSACCLPENLAFPYIENLKKIHPEILEKFYGCGSPIPLELKGKTVLDLGCGTGRDCYLMSQLVGPTGQVIGVDMTESQLEIARKHLHFHMDRFGYTRPNVEFRMGLIENLGSIGIPTGTIDIVVSNCVINLSPNKERVFAEIFRVLKPGGELHFSDVFSGRRVPQVLATNPTAIGECLGGALYIEDFRRILRKLGCLDFRVQSKRPLSLSHPELSKMAGAVDFYAMTLRAFKLEDLEDLCEDYGQVAYYLGTVEGAPHAFLLDDHHEFKTGMPKLVCGNTASMLKSTRFSPHFKVAGDRSVHYGPFHCGPVPSSLGTKAQLQANCC